MNRTYQLTDNGFDGHAEADRLQSKLHGHFLELSTARAGTGLPVFALEHGLSEGEYSLLQSAVRWLVERKSTFRQTPLPLVVIAAEIGYRYDGGEIWPIFSEEMPGWIDTSDTRRRVRRYFETFADEFSGAVPTGAWARKFSIICWPVVHSVLPKVFQRQLVEILYDNRYRLTSNVIEDSERLGRFIDGASWGLSDRFRNLAQNHALIGQVATALLTADDAELAGDETLLQSTVRRIVDDLSSERIARTWLREAQAATRTTFKGLRAPQGRQPEQNRVERSVDVVDPQLRLLRTSGDGWRLILELQDLSPLTQRHPELIDDLSQRRCRVNGCTRALAPSALLWPGQRVELSEQLAQESLLQLVGGTDRSNGHLADYCRLAPLPWLFRVEDGEGSVVLGRFVRPGSDYVLVTPESLTSQSPMVTLDPVSLLGLNLLRIDVPETVGELEIAALRSLGVATQTAVRVWPAGLANAGWNGADVATWLEGDPILVGIETDRAVNQMIVSIDGDAERVSVSSQPTYLALDGLRVGQHDVSFEAFSPSESSPVAAGSIRVRVRPRSIRPSSGSLREGLVLLTSPATPTLTELIGGDVDMEVLGPPHEPITARVSLLSRGKEVPLADHEATATLPLGGDVSRRLVSRLLQSEPMRRHLERCDVAKVTFRHRDLGVVETAIERPFTPLRWIVSPNLAHPTAHLVDNMDGVAPEVEFRPMSNPDRHLRVPYEEGSPIQLPSTGLLTAKANDFSISTIVAPGKIRDFADLGDHRTEITIERRNPSVGSLRDLVRLARLWRTADRPDFNAGLAARRVLQAISVEIAAGIGGRYWAGVEHQRFGHGRVSEDKMVGALSTTSHQRSTVEAVRRRLPAPQSMRLADLVATFSSVVGWADSSPADADLTLGEFCLRVASQPSSVADLPDSVFQVHATSMIEHPITLRLARYIVFRVDQVLAADFESEAPYEGFAWT